MENFHTTHIITTSLFARFFKFDRSFYWRRDDLNSGIEAIKSSVTCHALSLTVLFP